jgi:YfiH family protein
MINSAQFLAFSPFQKAQFITAAVSTRMGGVSHNPYHSLNLAYHVGDAREATAENRRRFCDALGVELSSLVVSQQIHGDRIAVVDDSLAGRGSHSHADAIPDTDGMITRSRSIALAVLTADCVPVLVVDPVREVIGIAHAGWRGTLGMIAAKTVLRMRDAFGTEPVDCLVALGPSIGPCCYEVDGRLISQFQRSFGKETCVKGNRLDLKRAIEIQLVNIGVERCNISSEELCTACNRDLFYSYRAEGGRTGRMMSVIKLI